MSQEPNNLPGKMASGGCALIGCGCLIPVLFILWLLFMGAIN